MILIPHFQLKQYRDDREGTVLTHTQNVNRRRPAAIQPKPSAAKPQRISAWTTRVGKAVLLGQRVQRVGDCARVDDAHRVTSPGHVQLLAGDGGHDRLDRLTQSTARVKRHCSISLLKKNARHLVVRAALFQHLTFARCHTINRCNINN